MLFWIAIKFFHLKNCQIFRFLSINYQNLWKRYNFSILNMWSNTWISKKKFTLWVFMNSRNTMWKSTNKSKPYSKAIFLKSLRTIRHAIQKLLKKLLRNKNKLNKNIQNKFSQKDSLNSNKILINLVDIWHLKKCTIQHSLLKSMRKKSILFIMNSANQVFSKTLFNKNTSILKVKISNLSIQQFNTLIKNFIITLAFPFQTLHSKKSHSKKIMIPIHTINKTLQLQLNQDLKCMKRKFRKEEVLQT